MNTPVHPSIHPPLHPKADQLIRELRLTPHPEGGWFREVFRSSREVRRLSGPARSALTTIYYLLARDTHSRWHRVVGEEVWHFYEGDPVELLTLEPTTLALRRHVLGPHATGHEPVVVVHAGHWQAARSTGDYTLVGCTMGPGFDPDDFELATDRGDEAGAIRERHPELAFLLV